MDLGGVAHDTSGVQRVEIAVEHKRGGLLGIEAQKADYAVGVWTFRAAGNRQVTIPASEVEHIGLFRPAAE